MKVISTTNLSKEGNDCYIYKSVSLVETFGMYVVIIAEKIDGWGTSECNIYCKDTTSGLDIAKHMYIKAGGKL